MAPRTNKADEWSLRGQEQVCKSFLSISLVSSELNTVSEVIGVVVVEIFQSDGNKEKSHSRFVHSCGTDSGVGHSACRKERRLFGWTDLWLSSWTISSLSSSSARHQSSLENRKRHVTGSCDLSRTNLPAVGSASASFDLYLRPQVHAHGKFLQLQSRMHSSNCVALYCLHDVMWFYSVVDHLPICPREWHPSLKPR